MRSFARTGVVCAALALGAVACSDSNGGQDGGAGLPDALSGDAGSPDARPGDAVVKSSLTVTVFAVPWVDGMYAPSRRKPLSGAVVAAVQSGGKPKEIVTGADGKVTFRDVDWSLGSVDLTAYRKPYWMVSRLGITRADGDCELNLRDEGAWKPSSPITVSGTLRNIPAGATSFVIGATRGAVSMQPTPTSPSYALEVEANKKFSILVWALENVISPLNPGHKYRVLAVSRVDLAASATGLRQDIDLSKTVTTTRVKGTVVLPTGASSVISKGEPFWQTRDQSTYLQLGIAEKLTPSAGNRFDYEGVVYKQPDTTHLLTEYDAYMKYPYWWTEGYSHVEQHGYPQDGATVSGFMDLPKLVFPPGSLQQFKASETIRFTNPEPGATVNITLSVGSARTWLIQAKPGTTSIELPELPAGIKPAEIYGPTGTASATLWLCSAYEDPSRFQCAKWSSTGIFKVTAN